MLDLLFRQPELFQMVEEGIWRFENEVFRQHLAGLYLSTSQRMLREHVLKSVELENFNSDLKEPILAAVNRLVEFGHIDTPTSIMIAMHRLYRFKDRHVYHDLVKDILDEMESPIQHQ